MNIFLISFVVLASLLFFYPAVSAEELTIRQDQLKTTKNSSFRYGTPVSFMVELDKKARVQMMDEAEYKQREKNLPKNGAVFANINVNSSSYNPEDLMVIIKKGDKVIEKRTGDKFDARARLDYSNGKYKLWGVFEPKTALIPPYDVHVINVVTNRYDVYKVRK